MENKTEVTARIGVYCGGKWGKNGEYVAVIRPKYFKNGNMQKTGFEVVAVKEIVKGWYAHKCAAVVESIKEILQ